MGGSSAPDHPDLPGNGMGMGMERKVTRYSASPEGGKLAPNHPLTQTYLAIGMKMERKAARYSTSPMGETQTPRPPTDPDLPGDRHEDGAKRGQVLSVYQGRGLCTRPPRLTWQ
jgi:hypothetical protein